VHFTELDELYEQAGASLAKRDALFAPNMAVVGERDDAENHAIAIKVAEGQYDEAIRMMTGRRFAVAEGANLNVDEYWTEAHILRGIESLEAKHYDHALADFGAALAVPDNLPLGSAGAAGRHNAEASYWTGMAYEGQGNRQKAMESWERAAAPGPARRRRASAAADLTRQAESYYQGPRAAETRQDRGSQEHLPGAGGGGTTGGQFAEGRPGSLRPRAPGALAHYIAGLGYLGLKDQAGAKAELSQAVQTDPGLAEARAALASLGKRG
jgi:tetratricopeptide (TPR) repeat protein